MNVGNTHHILAYLAAVAAALSVILAITSRFTGQVIVVTQGAYMTFATIAILFAIYFLVEGAVYSAKKGE